MRRLDEDPSEKYWKAFVYGPPGTGKTSMGVSAAKLGPTLILLSERQGMAHIRLAARRLGVQVPMVLLVEELSDYRDVINALHGDRSKPFRVCKRTKALATKDTPEHYTEEVMLEGPWPLTVVADSIGDVIGRLIVNHIRKLSPQKKDEEGLPKDADRFFNVLGDVVTNLVLELRDTPCHLLLLAHLDDKMVGKGNAAVRRITAKLPMKGLAETIAGAVNVVGASYRLITAGNQVVYQVLTVGADNQLSKPCEPLRRFEVPDFSEWVNRLEGHATSASPVVEVPPEEDELASAAPAAPAPVVSEPPAVEPASTTTPDPAGTAAPAAYTDAAPTSAPAVAKPAPARRAGRFTRETAKGDA